MIEREKNYLVNELVVHTKNSLLFIQNIYQQPFDIHILMSNQPIACLVTSYVFLLRKCFCYLCWNLEHILRGPTDVPPKYSKFLEHHRFGQKYAVLHLLYAGLKAEPTVKAVVT